MSKKVVHVNKKVFTVQYFNPKYKTDAMNALNLIPGVSAYNDNLSGSLRRDVTVTTNGSTELWILRGLLKAFGSVLQEKAVFIVTFGDSKCRSAALGAVKLLKGVVSVRFDRDPEVSLYSSTVPLTLNVVGEADPRSVLKTLREKRAAAQFA